MSESFFPATLEGWLRLLLILGSWSLALGGLAWKLMKQPMETQINGLGERVKLIELAGERHDTDLRKMDRALENSQHDRTTLHDRMGRIEGAVDRLVSAMERNRDAHMEEEGEIRERLVRIETKVDQLQTRGGA